MTTPLTFNSAYRCITMAMQNAGKLQEGQEPNSEQLATNMNRLADLISLWQTQGIKLWQNTTISFSMVGGQALYNGVTLGAVRNLRVINGWLLDSFGNRQPLLPLSWQEYQSLSNTTVQGPPNSYFVDKQPTQLNVYLWNTPDANTASTYTVGFQVQQQIANAVGLLDTIDFPQEWFIGLQWGLSAEICTGQPESVIQRCEAKAQMYRKMLEDWDVEDTSTMFTPDQRMNQNYRNFQ